MEESLDINLLYDFLGLRKTFIPAGMMWGLLMTAVVEIEKKDFGFKICRKVVEIYRDSTKEELFRFKEQSKYESLFKAVIEFIKWYNLNQ